MRRPGPTDLSGAATVVEEHARPHFAFGARAVKLLAATARQHLMQHVRDALIAARPGLAIELGTLQSCYYQGLRFMIDAHTPDGRRVPLIDGGAFDWLQRLAGNRKLAFVASALGSQLAATLFKS